MGTFTLVGAEQSEIIMLNDVCWSPSIIPWSDLLEILEGDIVHLPALRTFAAKTENSTETRHTSQQRMLHWPL